MFAEVTNYNNPCLLWSGGLDSTLLLTFLREEGIHADIVMFGYDLMTKKQKQRIDALIRDWDLKIFSYPPSLRSFIGDGKDISVVFDYAMGGSTVPVIKDVVDGDKCIADLEGMKLHYSPVKWDLALVGTRKDDDHYATRGIEREREWQVGETTFISPLFDWTRDEVKSALKAFGLPYTEVDDEEDSGNLNLCTKCLKAIEPVECPKDGVMINPMGGNIFGNLTSFRKRFQIIQ